MSATKIPGPEFGLVEYLNYYTAEELSAAAKGPQTYFPLRPSSAGKCARELAYAIEEFRGKATYEKKPLDPETSRIFAYGHDTERHFVYQFKRAKNLQLRHSQQTLSFFRLPNQNMLLTGSIDGVMVATDSTWSVLVDFKSKKDKHSSFAKTGWDEWAEKLQKSPHVTEFGTSAFYIDDLDSFYEANKVSDYFTMMNFLQLNFYYFSEDRFCELHNIEACSLLYYNKNDSRIREIRFKPSRKLYEYVKEKFLAVDASVTPSDVPREHALGSIACAFCPYSRACWGDASQPDKEFFKTLGFKTWPKDLDRLGRLGESLQNKLEAFMAASEISKTAESVEKEVIQIMLSNKLQKIRMPSGEIYELRKLKTGGPGGGPRTVLRRGKL